MLLLFLFDARCYLCVTGLAVAPLFTHVDPNANVILMASLTVFVGCLQSVKPSAPAVRLLLEITSCGSLELWRLLPVPRMSYTEAPAKQSVNA